MFYPNYLLTKFKNGKYKERKMAEWKQNESCKMQSKNNSASDLERYYWSNMKL